MGKGARMKPLEELKRAGIEDGYRKGYGDIMKRLNPDSAVREIIEELTDTHNYADVPRFHPSSSASDKKLGVILHVYTEIMLAKIEQWEKGEL
jgi:hypothetical protein